jgi:hypothetical protein
MRALFHPARARTVECLKTVDVQGSSIKRRALTGPFHHRTGTRGDTKAVSLVAQEELIQADQKFERIF